VHKQTNKTVTSSGIITTTQLQVARYHYEVMLTLMLKLRKKAEYSVLTSCLDILQCAHTCRNNFAQKNSQFFI